MNVSIFNKPVKREFVTMLKNPQHLAGALLLGICVAAYSKSSLTPNQASGGGPGRSDNPGSVLQQTLSINPGGPYTTRTGVPITLQGTYTVAGQTDDSNRLKSIGQALQSYLRDHGTYPPGALLNSAGQPTVSWRVLILPYLGQKTLYGRFNLTKPWDDPSNLCLLDQMPAVYRKSGAAEGTVESGFAGIQGAGSLFQNASAKLNGGHPPTGVTPIEVIAAGTVGPDVHLPWTEPGDIDIEKAGKLGARNGFSGEGPAFTPLVFLDGQVHLVPNNADPGSVITWTHVPEVDITSNKPLNCACAPPNSVDAGLQAVWELGNKIRAHAQGSGNRVHYDAQGFSVPFQAANPGQYTVTMHVFDRFGNEYHSSTKVEVR